MPSEQVAQYKLVYLAKSDGREEIVTKKKKKEQNAPTASQMDQTADPKGVTDFYRLVQIGDEKEVEWRRKLGGMLKRELGGLEHASETHESTSMV